MERTKNESMPWWMRGYLLFGAAETLFVGGKGFLVPEQIPLPIPASPLNARFTAALYLAAAVALLLAALVRHRADARIFVVGFSLAVTLIMGLTILHWSEFTANAEAARLWVGLYALDVVLAALMVVPAARLFADAQPTRHRLTVLFTVEAALLGGLGLLLLLVPTLVALGWPWSLPPVLAQLYSCFFLTYAVCALLAARESHPTGRRIFAALSLALTVFVLLASLLHLDRLRPDPSTWLWFGVLGIGVVASGWALVWREPQAPAGLQMPPGVQSADGGKVP